MDFPSFHPNIKDGFSIFMTREEKKCYEKYKNNFVKNERKMDSSQIVLKFINRNPKYHLATIVKSV
jgi:hypothetical protein